MSVELGRQFFGGYLCLVMNGEKGESGIMILASGPVSNSAAWRHEHEYVNTTTKWDNHPLKKTRNTGPKACLQRSFKLM